jgi:hypothetical protein
VDGHHTKQAKAERRLTRDVINGTLAPHGDTVASGTTSPELAPSAAIVAVPTGGVGQMRTIAAQVYQSGTAGQFDARCPPGWPKKQWTERLRKALGTKSGAFLAVAVKRLISACPLPGYAVANSAALSAALVLIEALAPSNEVEATLAVHIAALDAASGNMLIRMTGDQGSDSTVIRSNALAKLERAFVAMLAIYQRLKHGNRQVIRIEKVEIQAGAQAVVGKW